MNTTISLNGGCTGKRVPYILNLEYSMASSALFDCLRVSMQRARGISCFIFFICQQKEPLFRDPLHLHISPFPYGDAAFVAEEPFRNDERAPPSLGRMIQEQGKVCSMRTKNMYVWGHLIQRVEADKRVRPGGGVTSTVEHETLPYTGLCLKTKDQETSRSPCSLWLPNACSHPWLNALFSSRCDERIDVFSWFSCPYLQPLARREIRSLLHEHQRRFLV